MKKTIKMTVYQRKPIMWLVIVLCLFVILACAFYNQPIIRRYTIVSEKINYEIRIVHLADLHSSIYGNNNQNLIDMIKQQSPDIIALTGDIADDHTPIKGTKLLLNGIKDVAPMYYVIGNHEYWSEHWMYIVENIKDYDVHVLINEWKTVAVKNQEIMIAGLDDPDSIRYNPELENTDYDISFLEEREDDEHFKLLLAHRPELIAEYLQYNLDLILAGHAHGGQVRIPLLLNGLFAPNQGWFPNYAGGRYRFEATNFIVSRGLSYNPRLPRIFNPPEVVVIDVIPKK